MMDTNEPHTERTSEDAEMSQPTTCQQIFAFLIGILIFGGIVLAVKYGGHPPGGW